VRFAITDTGCAGIINGMLQFEIANHSESLKSDNIRTPWNLFYRTKDYSRNQIKRVWLHAT
jgi:hypothetical protein